MHCTYFTHDYRLSINKVSKPSPHLGKFHLFPFPDVLNFVYAPTRLFHIDDFAGQFGVPEKGFRAGIVIYFLSWLPYERIKVREAPGVKLAATNHLIWTNLLL